MDALLIGCVPRLIERFSPSLLQHPGLHGAHPLMSPGHAAAFSGLHHGVKQESGISVGLLGEQNHRYGALFFFVFVPFSVRRLVTTHGSFSAPFHAAYSCGRLSNSIQLECESFHAAISRRRQFMRVGRTPALFLGASPRIGAADAIYRRIGEPVPLTIGSLTFLFWHCRNGEGKAPGSSTTQQEGTGRSATAQSTPANNNNTSQGQRPGERPL